MRNVLLIILLFSGLSLRSQDIVGYVMDAQQEALEGATVYCHALKKGTVTDQSGRFVLDGIQAESVTLQFSSLGYEMLLIRVELPSKELQIVLENTITEMEEVVVSGGFVSTQDRSALHITSIGIEQLKKSAAPSLVKSIAQEAGVEMLSIGQGVLKPVIRGLTGPRVATLFRGAKIASQAWGEKHGIYIPEQGLERVEVIKGPASLLYGSDAMGGALNFIAEKPLLSKGRKSNLSLLGYSNSQGYNASFQTKKRSEQAYHAFNGGYQKHADYVQPNGTTAANSRYNQFYAQGIWGIQKSWALLEGAYSSSYTNAGLMTSSLEEANRNQAYEMQLPWHQSGDHIITTDATFWLGSWTFKPLLSYQLNHRKEFHAYYDAAHATATLDMSLRTSRFDFKAFKQTKDKEWILGAQGMHQSMLNEGAEQLIPDALTEEQAIFTLLNYKYVDWQWQAGARLDRRYIDVVSTTYLNPSFSLGASCEMGKQFLLKMNAAQGFRAPNLFELKAAGVQRGFLRYEQGNPELVSEQNRELDLSLHWRGEQSLLDLTLFYNYIQDYIYRKATTELYEGYTVYKHLQEDAVLTGAELGFDWHPYDWHWMRIKTTAAYLNAKTLESAEPLPLIPPLKWTAEISAEKEEWKGFRNAYFSVSTEYTFAQELVADNEAPSKAYSIMHMSAGASLSKHLDVGLSVNNLLNTAYVPHLSFLKEYGIYEPARNFMLKLTAHF